MGANLVGLVDLIKNIQIVGGHVHDIRLNEPCDGCKAPYGFKNHMPLSVDASMFSVSWASFEYVSGIFLYLDPNDPLGLVDNGVICLLFSFVVCYYYFSYDFSFPFSLSFCLIFFPTESSFEILCCVNA